MDTKNTLMSRLYYKYEKKYVQDNFPAYKFI